MKKINFISAVVGLSTIMLVACSSDGIGNDEPENNLDPEENIDPEEDIYKFETIEVPVTSAASFSEEESLINYEINRFGTRTLKEIIKQMPNDNSAFSPISAMMAVSVFHNTDQKVYGSGLNLNSLIEFDSLDDLNSTLNKLMRFLPYSPNNKCDISLANSVWLHEGLGPQTDLKDFLGSQYYAELYRYATNSLADADILKERVRKWIEIKTKGEMPNYKLEGDDSSSIVFNVTYFKGEWLYKFDPALTHAGIFFGSKGEVQTDMMIGEFSNIGYWNSKNWEAFCLPFDGCYDMIFVLPSQGAALVDAVSALDEYSSWLVFDCARAERVDLSLIMPKFKIENKLDLTKYIDGDLGCNLKHITKIEVDEDGAKAVAVTEVTDSPDSDPRKDLVLDRPFLYALVNRHTATTLMMGAVNAF